VSAALRSGAGLDALNRLRAAFTATAS
jgi:hypothetical protein